MRAPAGHVPSSAVSDWNFADVWETVAAWRADAPALSQGERRLSWGDFERRADGVAAGLLAAGLGRQAKVAQYLYSVPEYIESLFGILKASLVPVNTNYRYNADELVYLWDNADAEAVVFGASFVERVDAVRSRVPGVRLWLWVDDGDPDGTAGDRRCPEWATAYEELADAGRAGRGTRGPWGRSGDDLLLVYTGGTTGFPKGVMWRQDDLWVTLNATGEVRYPEDGTTDDVAAVLRGPLDHPPARLVPCAPLMHGTGLFTAMSVLNGAGSLVLLQGRSFRPVELLDTIVSERVSEISIVGDAFARPVLAELDAQPGRWDLSTLWLIISSGVMWSAEVKAGLLRHQPRLRLVDSLGSSEAVGLARSSTSAGAKGRTAGFQLGPTTKILTEDGREVAPGSGESGLVAIRGRTSLGYYKDQEKTATTFRVIDGVRWSIPGDWATVDANGGVQLLGRGSVCINTGGEKVFPEEVEEALKAHPSIEDALVVGVPDERFGETVVGVVELADGCELDEAALIAWVRGRLAAYKAPRRVRQVPTIGRAANGKADYRRIKAETAAALAT